MKCGDSVNCWPGAHYLPTIANIGIGIGVAAAIFGLIAMAAYVIWFAKK